MSNTANQKEILENAQGVIEAFGGIRPMAKKMEVAVTTVQGWKKRNAIPAARFEQVVEAARTHDVDLNSVLDDAANENVDVTSDIAADAVGEEVVIELKDPVEEPVVISSDVKAEAVKAHADDKAFAQPEIRASRSRVGGGNVTVDGRRDVSIWIIIGVVAFIAVAVFGYVLLQPGKGGYPVPAEPVKEAAVDKDGFFGKMIPADLSERVDALKEKAENAKEALNAAGEKAQAFSDDVLAEDAGTIEERAQKLGVHVSELAQVPSLAGVFGKIEAMTQDVGGQAQLDQSVAELSRIVSAFQVSEASGEAAIAEDAGTNDLNEVLDVARGQSDALSSTLGGVPQEDLKAAAMLLAMTQFRSSLNRGNEAFDSDLSLLMNLVGEDNDALTQSLTKLAPHAQSGVLTPSGLSNEFRTLAGEAVVASLSGEDVSLKERAAARMNDILKVEKEGELVSGTETQVTLAKAEQFLNAGDIAGAIAQTKTLDGGAMAAMAPWLEQANASLMAQQAGDILTKSMNGITAGGLTADIPAMSGTLIQDKEAGINIYVPGPSLP